MQKGTKDKNGDKPPNDTFKIIQTLCFFLGIQNFTPLTFFTTATEYWMFKFRENTTINDIVYKYNDDDPTFLQAQFASSTLVAGAIPMVLGMILTTVYGYKIHYRLRINGALVVMISLFVLATGFVEINTDSWQTGFFVVTMIIIAIINGSNALLGISLFIFLSKFPDKYLKTYLIGQSVAGIFITLLQIVSLAIGATPKASALIYFITACLLMAFTLMLFGISKNFEFYQFYVKSNDDTERKRKVPSFSEMKQIIIKLKSVIIMFLFAVLTFYLTHPAITSLVVSEDAGAGPWNDKYFVPVATFLVYNVSDFVGRFLASIFKQNLHGNLLIGILFFRMCLFVPLVIFCNAKASTRSHIPILLPHDYQYILVIFFLGLTSGYFYNVGFLNVPKLVSAEEMDVAFEVMVCCITGTGPLFSVLSLVVVDIL